MRSRYICPGMISLCAQMIPMMGFFISLSVQPSARISERWEDIAVPSEKILFISVLLRARRKRRCAYFLLGSGDIGKTYCRIASGAGELFPAINSDQFVVISQIVETFFAAR